MFDYCTEKNPRRKSPLEKGEEEEAFQGGSVQSPLHHVMFGYFIKESVRLRQEDNMMNEGEGHSS